jgi:precorrin isomerase
MHYIKQPEKIYENSFATIEREANLEHFSNIEREVVIRLIHACGMVDIVEDLAFSTGAISAGREALKKGAPIITDVNMVAKGIITRNLTNGNKVICALDKKAAYDFAKANETTRSAGGIEALKDKIEGAIITIGNAPTALFHLLEMVENGAKKPALILGFPVGFVGAIESKQALIENKLGLNFIALKGRRGGSSFAAAAANAIVAGLKI